MRRILMISLTVLATLAAGTALAQVQPAPTTPEPKPPKVVYPKNETVDFDLQIIRGRVFSPAEAFVNVRQPGKFPVMIAERSHFKGELAKSAVDLR